MVLDASFAGFPQLADEADDEDCSKANTDEDSEREDVHVHGVLGRLGECIKIFQYCLAYPVDRCADYCAEMCSMDPLIWR